MLKKIAQLYSFLRLLSLDIVLGAICGAYFASRVFNVSPSIYFWITLATAVWVIYTLDHLMDGNIASNDPVNYNFHHKNKKILIAATIIISVLSAFLVFFFLEKEIILFGILSFILVLLYLILNNKFQKKKSYFPKEFIISILYTWGIFGGMVVLSMGINLLQGMIVANYFLIALANVLLFSLFDMEKDKTHQFKSIALKFGAKFTTKLFYFTISLSILNALFIGLYSSSWFIPILLLLMSFILLISIARKSQHNKEVYAIITDAIFYLPVLIVLN